MNLQQLKQYLQNNLLYGENGTPQKSRQLATTALLMPDPSKAWGIDGSHWNPPPIGFQRMKDLYGLMFAIIKGCDGSLESRYVREHVAEAKAAGVPFGLYVWLYPDNKVRISAQVAAWVKLADALKPPMGIYIDAEWTTYAGQPANPSAVDLRLAHDQLRAKGYIATTYTAKGYADQYLKGFDWMREELWVASYGGLSLPTGATRYVIHQFTASLDGKQLDPNGNAELDGNYYNGTRQEFAERYNVIIDPPPTGVTNMIYITQVTTAALNGRSTPGGAIIWQAGMKANDLLICDNKQVFGTATWYHVRAVLRNSLNVTMPAQVWASAGDTGGYQRLLVSFETEGGEVPAKVIDEIVLDLATGSTVTTHYTDGTQTTETA